MLDVFVTAYSAKMKHHERSGGKNVEYNLEQIGQYHHKPFRSSKQKHPVELCAIRTENDTNNTDRDDGYNCVFFEQLK